MQAPTYFQVLEPQLGPLQRWSGFSGMVPCCGEKAVPTSRGRFHSLRSRVDMCLFSFRAALFSNTRTRRGSQLIPDPVRCHRSAPRGPRKDERTVTRWCSQSLALPRDAARRLIGNAAPCVTAPSGRSVSRAVHPLTIRPCALSPACLSSRVAPLCSKGCSE